ncbi:SEC-C metal-binding domain-containing protein [Paractinoplanes hotanensis]|uniref:SEC-C metal-binding domain-containing protein n=1 Tax=Paractinoplanes hotanensis TaxID=2906497 RepID=A0ABT0YHG0_9ACTN|nr:SEC-C metal-binding domain-containing protein [Actinoplanes hotanensis]MCM4084948.1 SEC-C metal-binding domain-containing protein [Actinoplanes hotanensis]
MPVNHLSEVERIERQLASAMAARPRDDGACLAALQDAVALTRTDADAAEVFYLPELLDELAQAYADTGRFDEALRTIREAVDAGLEGLPDSRCRIAEILMRAGRVGEAEAIWTQVRADTPGDVWLFNNAGLEYAAVGDHVTALAWLTDGMSIALDSGDPERLIPQLIDLRRTSMTQLDMEADDLQARAADFHAERERDSRQRILRTAAPAAVTGWRAAATPMLVALSWFPAEEYDEALARWPALTEPGGAAAGGRSHAEYCRAMQVKLAEAADSGMARVSIAPIRVDALLSWCAERGENPGEARAGYAADLARTRPEQLISWPPGRNEPCWCGSARKYKKCCGTPRTGVHG